MIKHEVHSGYVCNRVSFSRDLLEQERHFLLGHLPRKVDCLLFLLPVQSLQIVRKVELQGSMRCFLLLGEM